MNADLDPQVQTMISNMPEKTGKSLDEWDQIIAQAGLDSHGEIMALLKGEYGVTHGFANTISILHRQQLAGGPASDDELIKNQYEGVKAALKPIYDAVVRTAQQFGPDVVIAPKKSYVSLRRRKQFAIAQPATRDRVDLGLNLKDPVQNERLEGGNPFSGMCTHKVRLLSVSDVDEEVTAWLKSAYENA